MAVVKFNINYKTKWGEELCIAGNFPNPLSDSTNHLLLSTHDGELWSGEIELSEAEKEAVNYYYFVQKDGVEIRREAGSNRMLPIQGKSEVAVKDHWKEQSAHPYLYTSVFTEAIFKHQLHKSPHYKYSKSLLLQVICPYVEKDQRLVICGENDVLGNWQIEQAVSLIPIRFGEWQVELNADDFGRETLYKFAIVDNNDSSVFQWEDGSNRVLHVSDISRKENSLQVESGIKFRYASFHWKGKGVAIPLFSLRTKNSSGIGEFKDLYKMIDWAAETNQNMIQLLPINDTNSTGTWRDSYPYNSISIFALNPIYLSINEFTLHNKSRLKSYRSKAKKLNGLKEIDYEQVFKLKTAFLKELFAEEGIHVMQSTEYISFYEKNKEWLFPYVCFCYLRDTYNSANYELWDGFATYQPLELKRLLDTDADIKSETDFYAYLQFLSDKQLSEAKQYAQEKGIALKGDIPIGINRNSVEAWREPHLFNMQMQAGAPPDDFSASGQNWGFPTYNWEEMQRDGFAWWKKRFTKMADYFDAYRIDHILGFFRIWEIPTDQIQGVLGHFAPALPYSKEELLECNFPFVACRMTHPYIHANMLEDLFGEYAPEVANLYLDEMEDERFQLKEWCNTQQKIEALFPTLQDAKSNVLREGLFSLCAEVLFVADPYEKHRFHPRISAQQTYSYQSLDAITKEHYNHIYTNFFYKRHNQFWYEQAMLKLPQLIRATNMLVFGEDLGMVPDSVNWVMRELKILSLEIQRMPKEMHVLFADLNRLPYLSLNTTSTHDMSPLRTWWLENKEKTQYYYTHILNQPGDAPEECAPEICEQIVHLHLSSGSMWSVLPWQDWMSVDGTLRRENPHEERINIPSDGEHYWRYRMHISLEDLLNEKELNERIKNMSR